MEDEKLIKHLQNIKVASELMEVTGDISETGKSNLEYAIDEAINLAKNNNAKADVSLSELKDLLCSVSQLIQSWNATEAEWSEWDKEVQLRVHEFQAKIDKLSAVNLH